jgi:hypothetical protein
MPSLVAQTKVTTPPAIPEEARKHFVMGTTLFADAKSPADFVQVENEFKQAADLAPQWPEARYNLALAKEAAGDYSGAMDDLKLYQQFKLSETEARTVQDKIYALEAKQEKKAADAQADARAKADADVASKIAAQSRFVNSIQGNWRLGPCLLSISSLGNGNARVTDGCTGEGSFPVSDISVTESTLKFTIDIDETGNPEVTQSYTLSLNGNDRLTGSYVRSLTENGWAMIIRMGRTSSGSQTVDCVWYRQ